MALYLALGAVVGLLAGLFGIGGGTILVPALTSLFLLQGFPDDQVIHMALGSSMAAILFTSLASLRAHHSRGAVLWPVFWRLAPGIVAATFLTALLTAWIPARYLAILFACFLGWVSIRMMREFQPRPSRKLPGTAGLALAGMMIGSFSALVAIGGGTLTVPWLIWHNVDVRSAIGTSAAVGFPIALSGSAGYLLSGTSVEGLPPGFVGFIYLPAVLLVSAASFVTAPLGVRLSHALPVRTMRRLFAFFLLLMAIRMLLVVRGG